MVLGLGTRARRIYKYVLRMTDCNCLTASCRQLAGGATERAAVYPAESVKIHTRRGGRRNATNGYFPLMRSRPDPGVTPPLSGAYLMVRAPRISHSIPVASVDPHAVGANNLLRSPVDMHLVLRRLVDIEQTYTEMLLYSDGKPGFNLAHTLLPHPLPEGSR